MKKIFQKLIPISSGRLRPLDRMICMINIYIIYNTYVRLHIKKTLAGDKIKQKYVVELILYKRDGNYCVRVQRVYYHNHKS